MALKKAFFSGKYESNRGVKAVNPIKEAEKDLREAGISPRKVPSLRRKLIMHNSVLKHLKGQSRVIKKTVLKSASQTSSARLLAKAIHADRRGSKVREDTKRLISSYATRRSIQNYFYDPEVSTCLPGKKDAIKVGRERKQKRILHDTVHILHQK